MSLSVLPLRSNPSLMVRWHSVLPQPVVDTIPVIEENGVRLRLNIVDTPGYGDQVNNERW